MLRTGLTSCLGDSFFSVYTIRILFGCGLNIGFARLFFGIMSVSNGALVELCFLSTTFCIGILPGVVEIEPLT